MRKIVVLLASMAALLAIGVGGVLAQEAPAPEEARGQTIRCRAIPCYAYGSDNLVYERVGNGARDRILLKGGGDLVRANTYGRDKDVVVGSAGGDLIYVNDGDTRDRIYGGKGDDKCYVDSRIEAAAGCAAIKR